MLFVFAVELRILTTPVPVQFYLILESSKHLAVQIGTEDVGRASPDLFLTLYRYVHFFRLRCSFQICFNV